MTGTSGIELLLKISVRTTKEDPTNLQVTDFFQGHKKDDLSTVILVAGESSS